MMDGLLDFLASTATTTVGGGGRNIDTAAVLLDWEAGRRLASWAALVFLWGLGVAEFLTLSFRSYP